MNGIEWLGVIILPFVVVALGWPMALLWRITSHFLFVRTRGGINESRRPEQLFRVDVELQTALDKAGDTRRIT
jgi:hypothetical protein